MIGKETQWDLLIVDDDPGFVRDLLASWRPPARVRHAGDSEEAWREFSRHRPDLVCLELCLPHRLAEIDDEEGLRLLLQMRRAEGPSTPVVVLTRAPTSRIAILARQVEGVDLLVKPVEIQELHAVVIRLLTGTKQAS